MSPITEWQEPLRVVTAVDMPRFRSDGHIWTAKKKFGEIIYVCESEGYEAVFIIDSGHQSIINYISEWQVKELRDGTRVMIISYGALNRMITERGGKVLVTGEYHDFGFMEDGRMEVLIGSVGAAMYEVSFDGGMGRQILESLENKKIDWML